MNGSKSFRPFFNEEIDVTKGLSVHPGYQVWWLFLDTTTRKVLNLGNLTSQNTYKNSMEESLIIAFFGWKINLFTYFKVKFSKDIGYTEEKDQDGRGVRHCSHLPPQTGPKKHIYKFTEEGRRRIHTEHLLNAGRI